MEEREKQQARDAAALLETKVDTERIVTHPLARFLQQVPE
jgi:hypothetical protein